MIGLDTSAIIDIFKGDEKVKELLGTISEPLALTQASYLELIFGLNLSSLVYSDEEEFYDELFSDLKCFSMDINSLKKASKIFWTLKGKGQMIDQFDSVIAGIFLNNKVNSIITRNVKHFEKIDGLKVLRY